MKVALVVAFASLACLGCQGPAAPAKVASYPSFTNSVGMTFIQVPAGTFLMGSDKFSMSEPVHSVKMSSFWMMSTEVTNAQFAKYKTLAPSEYSKGADHPVASLTFDQVKGFIDWLNKQGEERYALPTEAQWEYAARGGLEQKDYPWGDQSPEGRALIGGDSTKPVGSYAPNAYGLYDMCGNVGEIVRETFYDYTAKPQTDPVGPIGKSPDDDRIVRGNGVGVYDGQIWLREFAIDNLADPATGFRLVCTTGPKSAKNSADKF